MAGVKFTPVFYRPWRGAVLNPIDERRKEIEGVGAGPAEQCPMFGIG